MKFVLIIDIDHPCIGHGRNVSKALERVARKLDELYPMDDGIIATRGPNAGVVPAIDGSIIGRWEISE